MGNKRVETVFDLARFGFDLTVACVECGRFAAFDAKEVIDSFLAEGRPLVWPIQRPPFRCACRSRRLEIGFASIRFRPTPLPRRMPRLQPIYVRPARRA